MEQMANTRNGKWHVGRSRQTRATVKNRYGHPYVRTVYRAAVFQFVPERQKWFEEFCPHNHYKRSAADRCAEQTARRWNRQDLA